MRVLIRNVTLWSLTLGHFSVDMLSGAMPIAVGLYLKDALALSLAQVGLMLGLFQLSSSLTQPLFGYLSDRYGGRLFAVGGLVWMASLQAVVGFMPTFETALAVATLSGLGSAAFHPQGAAGANAAAGEHKSSGIAMFMLGGNGGFAVGPIVAALAMGNVGIRGTAVLGMIGLCIAPFLYFLTGRAEKSTPVIKKDANWRIELNPLFSTIAIVALISVMSLRAMSQQAFSSFTPQFFVEIADFTKSEASLLSSLMLFVLAFGTLSGGLLADRIGGIKVMAVSMLISTPLMLAMFSVADWRAFWIAPVLGFVSGAAWPPMLVMAQSLFHKNVGVGTGVALGFVFAMGGLGLQLTGWLAEPHRLGLSNAMLLLSIIPLLTGLLALFLPRHQKKAAEIPTVKTAETAPV